MKTIGSLMHNCHLDLQGCVRLHGSVRHFSGEPIVHDARASTAS